jgi:hypothetical protein
VSECAGKAESEKRGVAAKVDPTRLELAASAMRKLSYTFPGFSVAFKIPANWDIVCSWLFPRFQDIHPG